MKKYLPFALLLSCFCWHASQAQWTSLGSGITTSSRVLAGFYPVNENVIWGYTANTAAFTPVFEFTRTANGGQSWLPGTLDGVDAAYFTFGIFALDVQIAWIATADELDPISGRIYKTTDGGDNWTHQSTAFTGFNETPAGVWFWNENEGFATGATCLDNFDDQISAYVTADGGENWTKSALPAQLPGEGLCLGNYNGFFSVAGDHVWFGTTKNRIFRSADRGHTWQVSATSFPDGSNITSVNFRDSLHGIALNSSFFGIARSVDGGATWTTVPVSVPTHFRGWQVEYVPGTRGTWFVVSSFTDHMISYDDGLTWEIHPSNLDAWSVEFLNSKTGFAGSYINTSSNGGLYKWSGAPLTSRIFVNDDATGANDGRSWADAFTDLQSALAIAQEGDQIWVAEGTYKPAAAGGSQTSTFLIDKNLQLYGGFAGTEVSLSDRGDPAAHPTVFSGDLNGDDVLDDFTQKRSDNALHVLTLTSTVGNETLLDGFIVGNGHAGGDAQPESNGGGIFSEGSPVVRQCVFSQNFSNDLGGAVLLLNATAQTTRFEHCHFEGNKGNLGGAVNARFSHADFEDCTFVNNLAQDAGAAPFQEHGGGIGVRNGNVKLNRCTFQGNESAWAGGGLFYFIDAAGEGFLLEVDSCKFDGNISSASAPESAASAMDGLVFGKQVSIRCTHSEFVNNKAFFDAGAVFIYTDLAGASANVLVDKCLFEGNTSAYSSSALALGAIGGADTSEFTVSNSVFKNNIAELYAGAVFLFNDIGVTPHFKLENCIFEGNKANLGGGALLMSVVDDYRLDLSRCQFTGNESTSGAAVATFQWAWNTIPQGAEVNFDNCLFSANQGESVIALDSLPGVKFLNCTIAGNSGNAIVSQDSSGVTLQNTILHNPGFDEYFATADASFSSLGGNLVRDLSLDGKLIANDLQNADPLFTAPGDFHLTHASPAVDAGTTDGVTATTDLDGNPRIQGSGVDAGAFESPFDTPTKEAAATAMLAVSPNPAADFLTVELPENAGGNFEAQVFDAFGKRLRSQTLAAGQWLDLQGLAPGAYLLKMVAGERFYVGKFVKR